MPKYICTVSTPPDREHILFKCNIKTEKQAWEHVTQQQWYRVRISAIVGGLFTILAYFKEI